MKGKKIIKGKKVRGPKKRRKKKEGKTDIWYLQGGHCENFFTWGNGAMQSGRYRQL